MWSRSRRLGLETVSTVSTNVSSLSRLGLGPMRLGSRLDLGAICLGLGPVGLVSDLGHCVSSRCFLQARVVHRPTVAAVRAILTSMTFCGL